MYCGSQNFVEKTATSLEPALLAGLLLLGDTAKDLPEASGEREG